MDIKKTVSFSYLVIDILGYLLNPNKKGSQIIYTKNMYILAT